VVSIEVWVDIGEVVVLFVLVDCILVLCLFWVVVVGLVYVVLLLWVWWFYVMFGLFGVVVLYGVVMIVVLYMLWVGLCGDFGIFEVCSDLYLCIVCEWLVVFFELDIDFID